MVIDFRTDDEGHRIAGSVAAEGIPYPLVVHLIRPFLELGHGNRIGVDLAGVSGDFARYLASAAEGAIEIDAAHFTEEACVGVTLTTDRYPYENTKLSGLPATLQLPEHVAAFWGTSTREGDRVASPGGRVLTVTASAPTVAEARERVYAAIGKLKPQFPPGTPLAYRSDITRF